MYSCSSTSSLSFLFYIPNTPLCYVVTYLITAFISLSLCVGLILTGDFCAFV